MNITQMQTHDGRAGAGLRRSLGTHTGQIKAPERTLTVQSRSHLQPHSPNFSQEVLSHRRIGGRLPCMGDSSSQVSAQAYLLHGNSISLDCEESKRNTLVYKALAYQNRPLEYEKRSEAYSKPPRWQTLYTLPDAECGQGLCEDGLASTMQPRSDRMLTGLTASWLSNLHPPNSVRFKTGPWQNKTVAVPPNSRLALQQLKS